MAQTDCCAKLINRDLSLVDLKASMRDLLVKWVINAFEGGNLNLCLFIQYRLSSA